MSTGVETPGPLRAASLDRQNALSAWLPGHLAAVQIPVTVVGDVILDGWWSGTSERLCREAPAPVVDLERRDYAPGGAANTAMNLAALGARVRMVGLVGADFAGRELRRLLEGAGVDVSGLIEHPQGVTTTKYRIVSGDQLILR
uniref:bifunctional heptose 7-phosphate kinase/heptose 1-phosphate adenyltransferase n=1 Tax=uncultured Aeromicrobium sp. TaxID=337820 RepID=UPI0025DE9660